MNTGSFAHFVALVRRSRRETALIAAAALVLIFLTGFSFWLTQRVLRDAEKADELNGFNAKLTQLVQLLRTIESSQRGYLITGQQDFLEPYKKESGLLMPMVKELQASAPKSIMASEKVAVLVQPLEAKLDEMQ